MANANPDSPASAGPSTTGPGRLLYQARQDLRLAPEDVAQIMHLSSKQIIALEQDDYKNLPGPTYIRGYLRSYAQLLGLSPDKVLETYNKLTIPSKPLALPKSTPPPEITSSDRLVMFATVGVAAIVLGLAYLWWRSDEKPPERVNPSAMASQAPGAEPALPPGMSEYTSLSTPGGAMTTNPPPPPTVADTTLQTVLHAATSAPPEVKSEPAHQPLMASGMILNVAPAVSPAKPAGTSPVHNDRAITSTQKPANFPPGTPRSRLVLHAVQESWADIRDAQDNKLLYENVPAGRSVSIEGVAPFSVFLGNADGVKVEFNGQNFDVSRYKRGQVARFTLGEDKAVNN